jgi:hypothetical protein
VCTPETNQYKAPEEGKAGSYDAGDAGTVEVERTSPTDLNIAQATPNPGWTQNSTAPSGPRVKVKFTNSAGPPWVVRFAASMDNAGQMIHIRVTTCE